MRSRTQAAGAGLATLALFLTACGGSSVQVCPDEQESLLADGTVQVQQLRAVTDPSAGSRLKGRPSAVPNRPDKVILLLDYSGSMYGGYGKPSIPDCARCAAGLTPQGVSTRKRQPFYFETPEFHDFLARWLDAASPSGSNQTLEILLFNARLWRLGSDGVRPFERTSTLTFQWPLGGASPEEIARWLSKIPGSPTTVDAAAAGATLSREALAAVLDAVPGEAVVWLLTDNLADQGSGSVNAADAERNASFYQLLRSEPRLQMIDAYPILKAEACSWLCGTSLFAYGFYVSHFERPESAEFHRLGGTTSDGGGPTASGLLWNTELAALAGEFARPGASTPGAALRGVPLRLKPVDTEVLSFAFELHRGQTLRCDQRAEYGDRVQCQLRAHIKNVLRHQTVESATLSFTNRTFLPRKVGERRRLLWASAVCAGQMKPLGWRPAGGSWQEVASPIELGPLAPLGERVVDFAFELPAIAVATRERRHLFDIAFTDRILLDGRIVAEIRDIRTRLFLPTEGLEEVYGARELPAIFRSQETARIEAIYPAGAAVLNDGQVLGLLAVLGLGLLGGILALLILRFQRLHLTVFCDDVEIAKVALMRLSMRPLSIHGSTKVLLTRGWSSQVKLRPRGGYKLRKDGSGWVLQSPAGEEEGRITLQRGWGGSRRDRAGQTENF